LNAWFSFFLQLSRIKIEWSLEKLSLNVTVFSECSRDGFIVYEKDVFVTKLGMKQLIIHMYGLQTWIQAKINTMENKFSKLDLARVRFFFFFGRNSTELKDCKNEIRMLYNDINFKSSVRIPDTPHETLILAETILNNNSLQVYNKLLHAKFCNNNILLINYKAIS
jgi:hypothetical protein